jgi:hypothetical protein
MRSLLRQPLRAIRGARRALGANSEQLTVDIDIDRARVDARKVGVQNVGVTIAIEIISRGPGRVPSSAPVSRSRSLKGSKDIAMMKIPLSDEREPDWLTFDTNVLTPPRPQVQDFFLKIS